MIVLLSTCYGLKQNKFKVQIATLLYIPKKLDEKLKLSHI